MPTVSVIIPCYNQARYVARAIDSVMAQTLRDWEAIVVDDGSTDGTAAIVSQYVDSRIQYVFQDNRGVSAARNTGIMASKGKYLTFLDGDDEWRPEFLECCLGEIETNASIAGVYTRAQHMDECGNLLSQVVGKPMAPDLLRRSIWEGGQFALHAALVRRDILDSVGFFDTQLCTLNDWDLWIRVIREYDMRAIDRILALYRISPGSKSTKIQQRFVDHLTVLHKYLGAPEGEPDTWPADKRRAYAFAYRSAALGYIAQGEADEGWRYLGWGIHAYPALLERLDTFYELACGDQPRGFRGHVLGLDVRRNATEMLRRLDVLFSTAGSGLEPLCHQAYGNAYLALGMLADQAGDWAAARRYLLRATRFNPNLLRDALVVHRFLKLCLGQRLVHGMRRLRPDSAVSVTE